MALKGTTRIELTNVKTGEKEVIEKDNLVTNAVSDLLQINPFASTLTTTSYYISRDTSLPVCPNLIGGILLYENALEEDPNKYYAASDNPLNGYSSNDINTTTDARRGSMNQTESGPLDDGTGYRFVFDFATSQANGTIASLGLTSKWGGVEGYGAVESATYGAGSQRLIAGPSFSSPFSDALKQSLFNAICMIDGDNDAGYAVLLTANNTLSAMKIRLSINTVPLVGDVTAPMVLQETTLATTIFGKYATDTYTAFCADGTDYIWGFQYADNTGYNSSGNAALNWIKIDPSDWSFTEGTWTIPLPLYYLGLQTDPTANKSYRQNYVLVHEGNLYVYSYDRYKIHKINLDNVSDIATYQFEDSTTMWPSFASYRVQYSVFNVVGNVVIFPSGYLIGDKVYPARVSNDSNYNAQGIAACSAPAMKYGPFLFTIRRSSYTTGNCSISACLMAPYLATINNLETPVTKTADKTMKITYILREEDA